MTAYRDEREALLHRVEILEKALGKERGERESAQFERERVAEELALVRRELRRMQGRTVAPPVRWLGVGVALAVTAMTGAVLQLRSAHAPDRFSATIPVPPQPAPVTLPPPVVLAPVQQNRPAPVEPAPILADLLEPRERRIPTRVEVHATLTAAQERARACRGGQQGLAPVRIVFSGATGRVTTARLTDMTQIGGAQAECLLREVRAARVEPFGNPNLTVTYPFRF